MGIVFICIYYRRDLLQLQRETFETMFRCGFYKLEEADATKITEKCQTLSQEKEKIEGE